jgi:predicted O-methyltransferase YrrM
MFAADVFSESGVRETVARAGYPAERIHFVKGAVEETIPRTLPGPLALLRLDTDWYQSTRHELVHLYPLLAPGGVLIVDDYGHWQGAARAVDEYFAAHPPGPLLTRIDYTGRLAVKA